MSSKLKELLWNYTTDSLYAFDRLGEAQAQKSAPQGRGQVTEPSSEKELIGILGDRGGELDDNTAGMPIVVHFCHKEFRRCDIMNSHLEVGILNRCVFWALRHTDHLL